MSPQNDPCRRLLLSEVLLEEYESLDQPQLDSNEQEIIEQAIHTVIRTEQFEFEKDPHKLPAIYSGLAQAYEALLYSKMAAAFDRNFPSSSETNESTEEKQRRERALDRLNQVRDRIIDAYKHAIALADNDPNKAEWIHALVDLYRRRHHAEIDLEEIFAEVREKTVPLKEHLPRSAEALHGEIVAKIYGLMAEVQKADAKQKCEQKYSEWQEKLKGAEVQSRANQDPTEHDPAERAAVADILGRVDDLRCKHEEERARIAAESTQQGKKAERTYNVNQKVLEDVVGKVGAAPEWEAGVKGTGSGKAKPVKEVTLADAEKKLAQTYRSALCLSGGGIRSAIFNLGILQGLARHGLLEKFDYLSTVSGGGFSGGWLTAWIYRDGVSSVIKHLKGGPRSPLKPEPPPLEHLRVYSNFLSPQPGLLSADTWTLVASLMRNLILNWMVFIPVLMMFLLVPRFWTSILFRSTEHAPYAYWGYLIAGVVAGWVSFTFIGWQLPSSNTYESNPQVEGYKSRQGPFILWCLMWMALSATALAVFFWQAPALELKHYFGLTGGIIAVPWLISMIKICRVYFQTPPEKRRRYLGWGLLGATILIAIAQLITAYLLRFATTSVLPGNPDHPLLYATFAVPLILLLMSLGGTLIAGFTSRFTNDDDQEWWARAGAWMFILVVSWIAVHLLVLYGPWLILTLSTTYYRIKSMRLRDLPWRDIGKIAGTAVGVLSGIITLIGGFSAKTPANAREAEKAGMTGMLLSVLTLLAAPIFLAFVFVLISLGTDFLLVSYVGQGLCKWVTGGSTLADAPPLSSVQFPLSTKPHTLPEWHGYLLIATPLRYLVAILISLLILTVIMGRLISTNNFSLQYLWRNRIIRACLGASRRTGTRRPNPFTGFDTHDNLLMHELRPQPEGVPKQDPSKGRPEDDLPAWQRDPQIPEPRKLMHVLNLALNLTGGKKLQWQDRRAESFTVSPLHSGSYWLGYRRSFCYGGKEGISLGAAIAISGAFASPNMGYMMTSPVVRFLMALFNVRFGAWLGNPGLAGEQGDLYERFVNWFLRLFGFRPPRPFQLRSPRLSAIPIVAEAFGSLDDESSYVYLSDGGHFENLGLYEMVLRRCRFIVVSDASSDAEYAFQSLAMAVRQIRIDLGVPIVIPDFSVNPPAQDLKNKYCALGTIRYSCVDRDPNDVQSRDEDFDGVLIYIKPSLIGEEPRDVINYWQGSNGFPQETITDQWFSEAQFESYRALGSHIIDAICDPESQQNQNQVTFAAFARKVFEHNQLDFRAFRESLGYFALENQSTATLMANEYPTYQNKVKKFLDKLLG